VTAKSAVTVRVNPAVYNFVRERHAGSTKSGSADRELVLVADSSVDRGGCLIETECGDIDARIQAEVREVEYAFFGSGN
jgi:flagellar assembly protein FliH